MPKSKRNRVYSLTNTRKKGMERKSSLVQDVRDCCDQYVNIHVFSIENMRNSLLKDVRMEWKHSRFFFGKNRIMQLALGHTEADEYKAGIHKISKLLRGDVGLLFTNQSPDSVRRWFVEYCEQDFARAGFVVSQDISIPQGPMEEFSHSLEPHLRSLGLPTGLEKGKVVLLSDHQVCTVGDTLTPEQARIIKLLGIKLAEFRVVLKAHWSQSGDVKLFDSTHCSTLTNDESGHEE